jgi:hypothetical protein
VTARRRVGPVERATRKRLKALPSADAALVALAHALAMRMDSEPSAAVARELRQTVAGLVLAAGERDSAKRDHLAAVVGHIGGAS